MPSFDIVSEVDAHPLGNAVDQAQRVVATRFDFKGSNASFALSGREIALDGPNVFQLQQMEEMLRAAMAKNGIDSACMELAALHEGGGRARRQVIVRHGLDAAACRTLSQHVKGLKLKVQTAVQGGCIRVTGKKRDELQRVMDALRELPFDWPLQFINLRD